MPLVRVTKDSWIDERYYKAGEIIKYNGPIGSGLELVSEADREALAKRRPSPADRPIPDRVTTLERAVGTDTLREADARFSVEQAAAHEKAAEDRKERDEAERVAKAEREKAAQKAADDQTAASTASPTTAHPTEAKPAEVTAEPVTPPEPNQPAKSKSI